MTKPITTILGGFLLCGCAATTCGQMTCEDTLLVKVDVGDSRLLAFDWSITVTTEQGEATCVKSLVGETPIEYEITCGGDFDMSVPVDGRVTEIAIAGAPSSVMVRLDAFGLTRATTEFSPSYQTYEPNGEHCSPTCKQSEHPVWAALI